MRIRRRLLLSLVVAAVAALSLTALVVGSSPGTFFDLTDAHGNSNLILQPPSPQKIALLAAIILGIFSASFMLLMRARRFPLVASILLIVAVQAGVYVSFSLYSFHEEPEFCARTCHVMEPLVQTLETPGQNKMMMAHAQNGTVLCLDCHSSPGPVGQAILIKTSMRHVWVAAVARNYNASNLGGPDPLHTIPDVFCLKCHGPGAPNPLPPTHGSQESKCALCHNPHAKEGVGTDIPPEFFTQKACVGCHENAAKKFEDVPTKHASVGDGDCRTCHSGHHENLTQYPDAVPSCTKAGCHDQDPANNASLASREHATFNGTRSCSECHGPAHALTPPPQEELRASCGDCHVKEVQPLRDSPTRHSQLAAQQGCDACHEKHANPPPPPPACDKSGCHDQDPDNNMSLVSLKHATFEGTRACADCHGGAHNLTHPSLALLVPECTKCHADQAQRIKASPTLHGTIANGPAGCAQCHKTHDPPTLPSCTDAGCHDQDPANNASLIARSHPTFDTTRVCGDCHGLAHDLKPPPTDALRKSCTECHAARTQSLRDYPSRHTDIAFKQGCDACHNGRHGDPPPACGKAGCHDQDINNSASLARIKHSSFENGRPCADCHGVAHNLTRPPPEILATECAKCHADDAQRIQSSLTSHGNLANTKTGCVQCHVSHDPPSIPSCADAKCHGAGAAVGNIPNANHAAFPADTCGGCHGAAHNLRMPSSNALQANCAKCHVTQAATMNASASAHTRLAQNKGCATCHSDHVEGGGPKTCTDSLCHSATAQGAARVPHPAVASAQCSDCHGKAHDLHKPTAAQFQGKCAQCHQTNATVILASQTKHGDIARSGQCMTCHKQQHGTAPPPACTDAGCHDNNANNSASLVAKGHAPAPGGAKCADCHGIAHDIKRPSFTKVEPYCADCHSATANKALTSPTAHGTIARRDGCDACHITHDAPSAAGDAKACTSSGCHDQDPANNASLEVKKHAVLPNCLGCHRDAHVPQQPSFSELGGACSSCHAENATKIAEQGMRHANVAAAGCQNCHKTHTITGVLSCRDAGCHDTNASNPMSLVALNHKDFGNVQACQKCHSGRHDLTIPSAATLTTGCTTCHGPHTFQPGNPHIDNGIIDPTSCTTCHATAARALAEGGQRADHGKAVCTDCHVAGNTRGAPVPPYAYPNNQSQITWLHAYSVQDSKGVTRWNNTYTNYNADTDTYTTTHRGNHTQGLDCGMCHQPHLNNTPVFPAGYSAFAPNACGGTDCHKWLGSINQKGFPNSHGANTSYVGSINPEFLLSEPFTVMRTRSHTDILKDFGCNGFCHNPAMTLEKAEAWGGNSTNSAGGVDPQIAPATEHGYINKCMDCHVIQSPANPNADDLHKTHASLVNAEKSVADTRPDAPQSGCTYCHNDKENFGTTGKLTGSCYNCHLSGHRPKPYYWSAN